MQEGTEETGDDAGDDAEVGAGGQALGGVMGVMTPVRQDQEDPDVPAAPLRTARANDATPADREDEMMTPVGGVGVGGEDVAIEPVVNRPLDGDMARVQFHGVRDYVANLMFGTPPGQEAAINARGERQRAQIVVRFFAFVQITPINTTTP